MSKRFGEFILVLFAMVLAQSCTVQKRVHMPGWYVSTHIFENGKSTNNSRSAEQLEPLAIEANVEMVNAESDSGPQMNEVMQDSEKILQSTIERSISEPLCFTRVPQKCGRVQSCSTGTPELP